MVNIEIGEKRDKCSRCVAICLFHLVYCSCVAEISVEDEKKGSSPYRVSNKQEDRAMIFEIGKIIYIVSLSMQIAGSLLLVKFFFSRAKRENILKGVINDAPSFNGEEIEENVGIFDIEAKELQYYATDTYRNIFAFIYIMLGYLLSVFGEASNENRFRVCLCVLVVAVLIISVSIIITNLMAHKNFPKDCQVIIKKNGKLEEIKGAEERNQYGV